MDGRPDALQQIVTIARQHGLTAGDIAAALDETFAPSSENRWRALLVRVLGFLGGTFVFAGVGVFVALQWENMNPASRVVVTLGSGVAAFVLGLLATREARFDKASAPMFMMAAALEPTGMLVAFNEFGSGGDWRYASLITCAVMTLQFAAAVATVRRSTPLFMTIFFATLLTWTALDLLDADDEIAALVIGGSLLLTAIGVDRTRHRELTPVWYLFGASAFLYGFFDVVESSVLELAFLGVAAGFVYLSAAVHSRMLLFVATVAILAYTGWYTGEHFADSIGWPLALIAFGIFMIGLSGLAFKIDRDYVRRGGRQPSV